MYPKVTNIEKCRSVLRKGYFNLLKRKPDCFI